MAATDGGLATLDAIAGTESGSVPARCGHCYPALPGDHLTDYGIVWHVHNSYQRR
jgi:hypothetical protein